MGEQMMRGEEERRVYWGSSRSGSAFADLASWALASVSACGGVGYEDVGAAIT